MAIKVSFVSPSFLTERAKIEVSFVSPSFLVSDEANPSANTRRRQVMVGSF